MIRKTRSGLDPRYTGFRTTIHTKQWSCSMNQRRAPIHISARLVAPLLVAALLVLFPARQVAAQGGDVAGRELPVYRIPNIGMAAEFYFSPDGKSIIGTAKREGDDAFHVYTLNIDGTNIRRINGQGEDACSYYFPDGKRIIWTSTRNHAD